MPNTEVDTAILIHVPTIWETTNRRQAFRALADVVPPQVAIVCIDRPVDLVAAPLKRPKRFLKCIGQTCERAYHERMVVVTPWLYLHEIPAGRIAPIIKLNRSLLRRQLQTVLRRRYPALKRVIQWIHHPVQRWVFEIFPEAGRIYHCYDEYTCSADGRFYPQRWAAERRVIENVDITFITSDSLRKRREDVAQRLAVIPNGIPEYFFAHPTSEPDEIDAIPQPRIGYVGNIFSLLDYELLTELCRRRPEWQFVFVGPIERESHVHALRECENAHFLGRRPHERLPAVLQRFDIALMPFVVNDFTRPLVPLKLFEYMAAGVPIVSTALPNLVPFADRIRLVENRPDTFIQAIDDYLSADRTPIRNRLRETARSYTWRKINETKVLPVLREVFEL